MYFYTNSLISKQSSMLPVDKSQQTRLSNISTSYPLFLLISHCDNDQADVSHPKEHKEHDLLEGVERYAGYSVAFSRAFRYLAFTSDFGEALRPVIHSRIVTGTYAIAISYCIVDVTWEAYKLHQNGYKNHHNETISLTQCIVERSAFQAIASIIVPMVVIHTAVDTSHRLFKRIGRFQKWGPSITGLAIIPFLPLYLDHPVESGLEWFFENYGPWAKKSHSN